MLTYQDVVGLCELTEEEVAAIAQHEHIPNIVAAEMGNYLVQSDSGVAHLRRMIVDDLAEAVRLNDHDGILKYKAVLVHFIETHPEHSATGR